MTHRSYSVWLIGSITYSIACYGSDTDINFSIINVAPNQKPVTPILEYKIPNNVHYSFTHANDTTQKLRSVSLQERIDLGFPNTVAIVYGECRIIEDHDDECKIHTNGFIGSFLTTSLPANELNVAYKSASKTIVEQFKALTDGTSHKAKKNEDKQFAIEYLHTVLREYAQENTCILQRNGHDIYRPTRWDYIRHWCKNQTKPVLYGLAGLVGMSIGTLIFTAWSLSRSKTFLNFNIHNARLP